MKRTLCLTLLLTAMARGETLERMNYNNPGLTVDLGVGLWAWPLPMDWDGDGDLDLVVSCPDVPFKGTYLFENPDGKAKMPVFKPPRRVDSAKRNIRIAYVEGTPRVFTPAHEITNFLGKDFSETKKIPGVKENLVAGKTRANQWQMADYDGDGRQDLYVGVGAWADYGWDNAFNEKGEWIRGPLHGYVFLLRNRGSNEKPAYAKPVNIEADGKPIDVYGMPSPNLADFDGDGDLDLICGEFMDGFTFFQNTGSRTEPTFAAGIRLTHGGKPIAMNVQMITPSAVDWDGDGDIDLVVGDEDGRVALVENTGRSQQGAPQFLPPNYFQQEARDVKFGALVTPVSTDWDDDGDDDLICGNTAGHIAFIENLDGGNPPKWAPPKLLQAGGEELRILAGPNGSIQGPCEAKWGYTTLSVADWDHDGLDDLVVNSIWGKVVWYKNIGKPKAPELAASRPVEVAWKGPPPKPAWNWWDPTDKELATQWRTTPGVLDWDGDGLHDLVMLDHEGYLALFKRERREGKLSLLPGERVFLEGKKPLRLNAGTAGKSGRRKLHFVDWDGDGLRDLIANDKNAVWYRNLTEQGPPWQFQFEGAMDSLRLAGHTTSPTTVDWNRDGVPELLLGAEDGRFYYQKERPRAPKVGTLFEDGSMTVTGSGVTPAKLGNGAKAYGNRNYTWYDLPTALSGWTFLQTHGGETAHVRVTVKKDCTLTMATTTKPAGWDLAPDLSFGYTDKGRTRMRVFRRAVTQGEAIAIPQGNWPGGVLLIPTEKPRSSASKDKPNVLFIAVDDMRVALGCYGDPIVKSPNIDKLAAVGLQFNRAYCQQAVCNPSRASVLTGLRPETLGIWNLATHFREVRPDVVTLPQLFKQQGYFTQNIGKIFHNWRQDRFKGDPASWSVPAVMHYNSHGNDKAQVRGPLAPNALNVPRTEMRDLPDTAYFDGRIAELAVKALRGAKDERFFLAVGFWKPHAPFNAPKKYWDLYQRSDIKPPANPLRPKDVPDLAMHDSREIMRGFRNRPGGKPTAEEVLTLRHGYYAAISYVDAQIGKVLNELDRLGLREKTIVVFWSDHGFHLGEHALWAKTSNFELDARVPVILSVPGRKGGGQTDAVCELLDLYPTLAELCDLPAPKDLEGVSLVPLLKDPGDSVKPAAYTWHPRPAYPDDKVGPEVMGYSMRTARYRYTEWRDHKTGKVKARELYDHERDPRETRNLANRPEQTKVIERLTKEMK